jgi:hypothetical protein
VRRLPDDDLRFFSISSCQKINVNIKSQSQKCKSNIKWTREQRMRPCGWKYQDCLSWIFFTWSFLARSSWLWNAAGLLAASLALLSLWVTSAWRIARLYELFFQKTSETTAIYAYHNIRAERVWRLWYAHIICFYSCLTIHN